MANSHDPHRLFYGNDKPEWYSELDPPAVPPSRTLDFSQWFKEEDNSIELIHATGPIELRNVNKMWLKQSKWMYPKYKSLEAYVSFFAFGRKEGV